MNKASTVSRVVLSGTDRSVPLYKNGIDGVHIQLEDLRFGRAVLGILRADDGGAVGLASGQGGKATVYDKL